jgi:single-strand DNA-binding protein
MKSMNKVQLIGYLGKDPDIREYSDGKALAIIRLATDNYYKAEQGSLVKCTQWHTVKLWGKEAIMQFCKLLIKGSHVMVEGQLAYDIFTDEAGRTRCVAEIKAKNVVDLDR